MKNYFWCAKDGSATREPFVAGIDMHYGNLQRLVRHKIYDLVIHGNATTEVSEINGYVLPPIFSWKIRGIQRKIVSIVFRNISSLPFQDRSFDTVLGFEIMEHLTRTDGFKALEEFERVARKRVILSTPNKECLRDGLHELAGFNKHEAHLSWWKPKDFRQRGYRIYGFGVKLLPQRVWGATELSYLSYRFPFIADSLLCIKKIDMGS